jgi:hypothetical protein
MVLRYEIDQVWEQEVGLVSSHPVDSFSEAFVDEDGFPSSNGYLDLSQRSWVD